MGSGGVPSGGVYRVDGRRGDLDKFGKPNSRCDLYVDDEKVQSRWYDWQGRVIRNRDYDHQDAHHTHKFPHDHGWTWNGDTPERDINWSDPDYFNYPEIEEI